MPHDPTDTSGGVDPATLRKIEFSRRCFWFWIVLASFVEAGSLIGFIVLADWRDPLHQLLAVMSLLIYGTLGLCMMALFVQVRYWMLRTIKAIELMAEDHGPA